MIGHSFQHNISAVLGLILIMVCCTFPAFGTDTVEGGKSVAFGTETDAVYQYLWRGISYNRGLIAQPSAWLSRGDFTLSAWCNITLHDFDKAVKQHEVDLTAQCDLSFGDLVVTPSINIYFYPNQTRAPTTGELAFGGSYFLESWEFFTNQFVDFIEYRGAYYGEIGFGYSFPVKATNTLSAGLNLGWASGKFNAAYNGISQSTLSSLALNCRYNFKLTESVSVQPHAELFRNLNSSLRKINQTNRFNFGILFTIGA